MAWVKVNVDSSKVLAAIKVQAVTGRKAPRATVGYSAVYAAKIHEDLQMHHNNGSAKYLEIPARTQERQIREVIMQALRMNRRDLEAAVRKGAEYLLAQSRLLVPVRTGALRDSGFVKVE